MLSFKHFLESEYQELSEKLITLAGQAYPKFGQVVIMAGGAGSGKGFVRDKLLGVEGMVFDVDALKTLAAKAPLIQKKAKEVYKMDIQALAADMKNPDNVSAIHSLIGEFMHLDDRKSAAAYKSIMTAPANRKPNLIFDVTLSSMGKLKDICHPAQQMGYDPKNIHIIWVINDIEVAKVQNMQRDRVVPAEILISTHRGASESMKSILSSVAVTQKFMNGDIVLAFNQLKVDSEFVASKNGSDGNHAGFSKPFGGSKVKTAGYIKAANYFYVKKSGHPMTGLEDINKDLRLKIASYVPKNIAWV